MKKHFISAILAISLATSGATAQTATTDPGVVINGVKWATRNVDAVGTFADTPEEYGKFYQWNRKVAWSATEPAADTPMPNWDSTTPEGSEWTKANDPSPAGWRVPTSAEQQTLLDSEKVTSEWTTQNSITGRKFTDIVSGNSIFFPAASYRNNSDGALYSAGNRGNYWSSTQYDSSNAYILLLGSGGADRYNYFRSCGLSVRAVADNGTTGINATNTDGNAPVPVAYYTLLGAKLPAAPESGIYIILYDNGTATKVMK